MKHLALILLLFALMPQRCARQADDASPVIEWYVSDNQTSVCPDKADVFYICSTDVLSSGDSLFRAHLTDDDKDAMKGEIAFMQNVFGDEFNFFSPYYHQFTLDAAGLPEDEFADVWKDVTAEICEDFEYYIANLNGGRPFILAGFSQGAMAVLEILKSMDDDTYSQMVAAYMLGYRLTGEDLEHPHVKAAQDAGSSGVTISFNSVSTTSDMWPLVSEGAATCINPLNWTTDATPAELSYDGDTATVSVDQSANVLVVSGLDTEKYRFPILEDYSPKGNLHHWDILFYDQQLHANAILRAYGR